MKQWIVSVWREGRTVVIGQVSEESEPLARCAALSRFGASEDEVAAGEVRSPASVTLPNEDFGVSPML